MFLKKLNLKSLAADSTSVWGMCVEVGRKMEQRWNKEEKREEREEKRRKREEKREEREKESEKKRERGQ